MIATRTLGFFGTILILKREHDLMAQYPAEPTSQIATPQLSQVPQHRAIALLAEADPNNAQTQRELASSYNTLGDESWQVGKQDEALTHYTKRQDILSKLAAADLANVEIQRELSASCGTLGRVHAQMGNLDEAVAHFMKSHAILEKLAAVEPNNPYPQLELSNSHSMLGFANMQAGKLDQAQANFTKSLEICERMAASDPNFAQARSYVLNGMGFLASASHSAGKIEEILPFFERTLERLKLKLGAEHSDTILSMHNLAVAYRYAGRLSDAESLLRAAVEIARPKLGMAEPNTRLCMRSLAVCYLRLQQPEKAELLWQEMATFWKDQPPSESAQHAGQLAMLGSSLLDQKQPADAEPVLRECLLIRENLQSDDWSTFNAKSMLGGCLVGQKNYVDAEPLLLSGYEGMKEREAKIPREARSRMTDAGQRLVDLYDAWDKKDQADVWRLKLRVLKDEAKRNTADQIINSFELKLEGHTSPVMSVAFSADGKLLASASGNNSARKMPGEVKVWDATSGQETLTLEGHTGGITSVAFSPDGKRLVTRSWDDTVKVWDTTSGEALLTLKGHVHGVTSVAFGLDGKRTGIGKQRWNSQGVGRHQRSRDAHVERK